MPKYSLTSLDLLSFKNGSLTRERIRDLHAHKSWEEFNSLVNSFHLTKTELNSHTPPYFIFSWLAPCPEIMVT